MIVSRISIEYLFYGSLESNYDGMLVQWFSHIEPNDPRAFPPPSNPWLAIRGLKIQRQRAGKSRTSAQGCTKRFTSPKPFRKHMKHRRFGPLTLTVPHVPRLEILPVAFSKVFSKTSSMASSFYPWLFEWNINKPWGLDNERWIVEKKYEGTEEGSSVLEPKKDHPQRFHPTWTAELAMEALVPFSLVITLQ